MISATVRLKFQSISEFNELIQKLNPQIEIEISDTSESDEFKQKLLNLGKDDPGSVLNQPGLSGTYTEQGRYDTNKLKTSYKPITCPKCEKDFIPHHNRVKWCPKCQQEKKDDKSKKVRSPRSKPD